MRKTENGYQPGDNMLHIFANKAEKGWLVHALSEIPELKDPKMPHYQVHEFDPILDSSDMDPSDWTKIALDIKDNYDQYDGFVVIHGM